MGGKKYFSFWDRGPKTLDPKTLKFSVSFALFQVEYLGNISMYFYWCTGID